jgi:plasmid stabilization system protein ParE
MKIQFTAGFSLAAQKVTSYIAQDKPSVAWRFYNELTLKIEMFASFPEMYPISKHTNNPSVRDMVFKGYTIVYQIDAESDTIKVLDLFKWQDKIA